MTIFSVIVDALKAKFAMGFPRITSVVAGLGFMGVKLETGAMGVSYTVTSQRNWHSCTFFPEGGALEAQPVSDVLSLALADDASPEDRTFGLATASALTSSLLSNHQVRYSRQDTLDFLDLQPQDHVAMVGSIRPIIPQILQRGSTLTVIDNNPQLDPSGMPFKLQRDPQAIQEANKVILTGSSLGYDTLDDLLDRASAAEKIILLGPSATLPPNPLKAHRVVALGGILIKDTDYALKALSQGAGTPALMRAAEKITILPD